MRSPRPEGLSPASGFAGFVFSREAEVLELWTRCRKLLPGRESSCELLGPCGLGLGFALNGAVSGFQSVLVRS